MSRVIAAFAQFFDGSGDPLENGWLRFLETGTTTTHKTTYTDVDQTIPNANPIQLDAEGRCPSVFGQGIYRVVLYENNPITKAPGAQIAAFDPVRAEYMLSDAGDNFGQWDINTTYQVGEIAIYEGLYYRSHVANNVGNQPDTNPDEWERIEFLRYWNTNVTYNTDDLVVYDGLLYFSLTDSNQGNQPDISLTDWTIAGGGTLLTKWEEFGDAFRPQSAGFPLGDATHEIGDSYFSGTMYYGLGQEVEITYVAGVFRIDNTDAGGSIILEVNGTNVLSGLITDGFAKAFGYEILSFGPDQLDGLAEKSTPVNADVMVIEDSADSNNKKFIQLGNIPSSGASSEQDIYSDLLASTKYQNLTFDDFTSESLVDGTPTTMSYSQNDTAYNFTAGQILQSIDLYDATLSLTVTECMVSVVYSDSGTPTIEATADGTNWETVTPDEVHTFANTGTVLKLRFTGGGSGSVESWAILYNPDGQAITDEPLVPNYTPVNYTVDTTQLQQIDKHLSGIDERFLTRGRNYLDNSNFRVDQRGDTFTGLGNGDTQYTFDRWRFQESGAPTGVITLQRISDHPNSPNAYCAEVLVTTAQTSLAADDHMRIEQRIEARGLQDLNWGGTNAEEITLSFWVKSNLTGKFAIGLYQDDGADSCATTYTINVADTWEKKIITFPANTVGIVNDKGIGLRVWITFASGTNYAAAADKTWEGGSRTHFGTINNLLATLSNYLRITDIQLEKGSFATQFEYRPYLEEYERCLRYYIRWTGNEIYWTCGQCTATVDVKFMVPLPVPMRDTQSMDESSAAWQLKQGAVDYSSGVTSVSMDSSFANRKWAAIRVTGTGFSTTAGPYRLFRNASTDYIGLSAEL